MTRHFRRALEAACAISTPRMLTCVFLLALVLRAGIAAWLPAEVVWADGARYEQVALNLLDGEGFGSLRDNQRSVPTQALLIAAVYAVAGEQNYLALRLFFAVLGAVSCVLAAVLADKLFGRPAGLLAGVGAAGYPYLVYLSALFEYPQTFFILMLLSFLLLFYRFRETDSYGALFLATLCLGLAVLSVPTALIFAAVFGAFLVTRDWRRTVARLAVCAVAAALTVGAWTVRNYAAYDRPVLVNTAGGAAFWLGNNETYWRYGKSAVVPTCGRNEGTEYCRENRAIWDEARARGLDGVDRVMFEQRRAWEHGREFVADDPARFALLAARKLVDLWRPVPDAVNEGGGHGGRWRDLVAAASYLPVLALAILGVVLTAREWRRLLPVYVLVGTFVAPYLVFFPTTRYRLPIDMLLIAFAAAGAVRLVTLGVSRASPGLTLPGPARLDV